MDTNPDNGQSREINVSNTRAKTTSNDDFVLEKSIFSNVFEKDIQKVFIYKKTERLAKAIHLISPAFIDSPALRTRLDTIAVHLIDAGAISSFSSRTTLARELLALSSVLAIARTTAILSNMNADLISREAQYLLQEVAAYEEPRISFDDAPTLAQMMKTVSAIDTPPSPAHKIKASPKAALGAKGHIKDNSNNSRRESVLALIKDKKNATIKDISTHIKGVSEKTIQRELQALIVLGMVAKKGDRRWSTYSIA